MKHVMSSFITVVLTILVFASCSGTEDIAFRHPYLYKPDNTECLKYIDADLTQIQADDGNGSFEMILEGTTAKCKFISLDYPCDFEKVNIKITYHEGTLTIIEHPSSDNADCRCETDATFSILNIPEEDFILKIYHGDTSGRFKEEAPKYTGRFNVRDGSLTIPYHI